MFLLSKPLFEPIQAKGWLPWGLFAPVLGLIFIILATLPAELILPVLGLMDDNGHFRNFPGFVTYMIMAFPLMGGITLAWVKWVEKRSFASIGLLNQNALPSFFQGITIGIASSGLIILSIGLIGGYQVGNWLPGIFSMANLLAIIVLFLCFSVQSSVEEVLFRGWLFSLVSHKFNKLIGIIVSAALFTLLHFSPESPWYINANSFMFSVFACYLVLDKGNVWSAMGWHAGWNWFIGVGFGIPLTGIQIDIDALIVTLVPVGDSLITGGDVGPEGSLSCFMFFLIASIYLHRKIKLKEWPNKQALLNPES